MSKLRSVRTEIAKMKRELEAKEAAYRKEALAPSMDVLAKTLLDDEEFCEVLEQYSKDEVRVIAKHIALAHSLPEDGALKDAMGLTVLSAPVSFGESENDPVKYIFTLSITGNRDHMTAMSELVNLFNDPYFWHIVDKTEEPEIIVNYMEAVCG